jgi:hypothetical protein
MKTQNEKAQAYIREGITECRALGLPNQLLGDYCAGYLANKLATVTDQKAQSFNQRERDDLADWMVDEPVSSREVVRDLDWVKVASIVRQGEFALGEYLMSKLTQSMIEELESTDAEPDHIAEDDMRQRTRDAKADASLRGYW